MSAGQPTLFDRLKLTRVLPIIRAQATQRALALAEQVLEEGVDLLEVSCTTPGASQVIRTLSARGAYVGAGTVLDASTAREAAGAGARFLVAPNFSPEVWRLAQDRGLEYIPGTATPTEIAIAVSVGIQVVKLFPAVPLGLAYLRAVQEVFPHTQFMPTGGITVENARDWLASGALAVGIGGGLMRLGPGQIRSVVRQLANAANDA